MQKRDAAAMFAVARTGRDDRDACGLAVGERSVEVGDSVLFSPEDRYEVEVRGDDYLILRERDIHAVAAPRIEGATGLYL